jgi:hypothetical protein
MFIILIFTKVQIQKPKKWISYVQMTHEYWNDMAVSYCEHPTVLSQPPCYMFTNMNMNICHDSEWQWDPLHLQVRMSTAVNIMCPIKTAFFIPVWERFLLWRCVMSKTFYPIKLGHCFHTVWDHRKQCFNASDKWTVASCNYLICSMWMLIQKNASFATCFKFITTTLT